MCYSALAQSVPAKVDSLIKAYASLNKFNGNILITKAGQEVFEGSYGYNDIEKNIRCSRTDVFQLASLTKTFTAVLILKLIEEKKLSLDTHIKDFFPKLHPEKNITIANLLNHTSGIREVLRDSAMRAKITDGRKTNQKELLAYCSDQPLDFEPGTEFSYSNSGFDLLGMIIEKITGKSYGNAVEKYIFKPLKMTHSGFDYAALKSKHKTVGYEYLSATRHVTAKVWDWSWTNASGGLYSTVDDLLLWDNGLKNNRIITAKMLSESYTAGKGDYGYGWFIDLVYGKKVAYHPGNLEGATSYFGRIPQDDICIVMLTNQTSTTIETIASKIIAILNGKPYTLPKAKQEIALAPELIQKYIGRYDISNLYETSIQMIDNKFYLNINNGQPIRIYPETKNSFFVADSNMSLIVKTDDQGKLTLVIRDGLSTKSGEHL